MTVEISESIPSEGFNLFAVSPEEDWKARGACIGDENPDAWGDATKQPKSERNRALGICKEECSVRDECYEAGTGSTDVVTGMIWGGEVLR